MKKNSKIQIRAIVAMDESGGIAKDGKIPWHFPKDFAHFKRYTLGSVCVMGRHTYEGIAAYNKKGSLTLLPDRRCIVLSSTLDDEEIPYKNVFGAKWTTDMLKVELNSGLYGGDICIIGGVSLYESFAPLYDRVSITTVKGDYDCTTFVDRYKMLTEQHFSEEIFDDEQGRFFITEYYRNIKTRSKNEED